MPPLRGIEVRKFFKVLKNRVYCSVEESPLCAPSTVLETLHTVLHVIITQTLPSRCLCSALLKRYQNLGSATARGCRNWKQQLEASAPALPLWIQHTASGPPWNSDPCAHRGAGWKSAWLGVSWSDSGPALLPTSRLPLCASVSLCENGDNDIFFI